MDVRRRGDCEERRGVKSSLEALEVEPCGLDRRLGVPRRLATAQCPRPEEPVDDTLKRPEEGMPRSDVLPEAKLSAGPEDAPELLEDHMRVGDAAENAHDDDGVEGSVVGGKPLGDAVDDLDPNYCVSRRLSRKFPRCGIGLDREQCRDLRRVVLERTTVPRADLEHAPLEAGKEPPAQLARAGIGPPLLAPLEEASETALLRPVERRAGGLGLRHGRIDGSSAS
jgi:hypothetical protein